MESNGEPLKIHISEQCKNALEELGGYIIKERGYVNMKGKGDVLTYWLEGTNENAIKRRDVRATRENVVGFLPTVFLPRLICCDRFTHDKTSAAVFRWT